jgi:hypothetical protein
MVPVIEPGVMNKIVAALSTRYSKPVPVIRPCITEPIHEYGTVKITIGGADTLHASGIGSRGPDRRDATFVRVRSLQFSSEQPCYSLLCSTSFRSIGIKRIVTSLQTTKQRLSTGSSSTYIRYSCPNLASWA